MKKRTTKRVRNSFVADMVKGALVGTAVDKAKNKVVKYYGSKKRKRKNPDEMQPVDNTMLPASEVASLVGGEFIPLKGMIVTDDTVQLLTKEGTRISNPAKATLKRIVNGSANKPRSTRVDNPVVAPKRFVYLLQSSTGRRRYAFSTKAQLNRFKAEYPDDIKDLRASKRKVTPELLEIWQRTYNRYYHLF